MIEKVVDNRRQVAQLHSDHLYGSRFEQTIHLGTPVAIFECQQCCWEQHSNLKKIVCETRTEKNV